MTVSTFTQPDYPAQSGDGTKYPVAIDDSIKVMSRRAAMFAPHEQATPDMTIKLDAGSIYSGINIIEKAAQTTGTITAPSTNPRIDRVVIARTTGAFLVVTGTEDASPVAPAITAGFAPVARIALVVSQTSILNIDITDERILETLGSVDGRQETKTVDYTALLEDLGTFLHMDKASAITLDLTAAATLGAGWYIYVYNRGVGTLTIDPNGAETINNSATIDLAQNDAAKIVCDGDEFFTVGLTDAGTFPRGHLAGLILSNDSGDALHDINVTAGETRDDVDTADVTLPTEQTKQIDATWATGDDAGGMSSTLHPVSSDTTYHFFVFIAAGIVESGFDTSVTGANLATDHSATNLRRLGSITTDGSDNVIPFTQVNDEFLLKVPVQDYSDNDPGTASDNRTLATPAGIKLQAIISIHYSDIVGAEGTIKWGLVTSKDQTNTVPSSSAHNFGMAGGDGGDDIVGAFNGRVRTDTSSIVRTRVSHSTTNLTLIGMTHGWIDTRGKGD